MPEVPRTWLREAKRIDLALYAAIAATPTPVLDRGMSTVSRAADHSRLWLSAAAILAISRGPSGRRAAGAGLASVAATSIGRILPREAVALQAFAAVVAYSRVHTGVHYPADVVTGSLIGVAVAQLTGHRLERRFTRPS